MTVTFHLDDPLATRLQVQASVRNVSPEQLAQHLLGSVIDQLEAVENWPERNRRRGDLIRKKFHGGGLTAAETTELEQLDAELDRRLAPLDEKLLEQLGEWEKAARRLQAN